MKRLALLLCFFLGAAQAQTYPTKPIRLVVPFAPGGSSSIVARSFAAEMEKGLGQPFVIENKGGGGGKRRNFRPSGNSGNHSGNRGPGNSSGQRHGGHSGHGHSGTGHSGNRGSKQA